MLNEIINSERLRLKRTILIYLLIISYLTTFSSCMTTESLTVSPDSLSYAKSGDITKIILKNGKSIDCENMFIEIIKRSDSIVALSIYKFNRASRENAETYSKTEIISLNDILTVQLEKNEIDTTMTILLVSGIVILVGGLIALETFLSSDIFPRK